MRLSLLLCISLLSCLLCKTQLHSSEAWQSIGLSGGGSMYKICISPVDDQLMMLACDMGAYYISENGGKQWCMIHHQQLRASTICGAAFHPLDKNIIIATNSWHSELFKSTDLGLSWQQIHAKAPWRGRPNYLQFDPNNPERLFIGVNNQLYLSNDMGETAVIIRGCSGLIHQVVATKDTYIVGTERGVYTLNMQDLSALLMTSGLPNYPLTSFAGASKDDSCTLYVATETSIVDNALSGGIYRSTDFAKSWQRIMNPHLNCEITSSSEWSNADKAQYRYLNCSLNNPTTIFVYCDGTSYNPSNHATIYRSDDSGDNWRAVSFSDPRFKEYNYNDDYVSLGVKQRYQAVPYHVCIAPNNPDILAHCDGGTVFRSENGGTTWQARHCSAVEKQNPAEPAWLNNGLVTTSTWYYNIDPFDKNLHYICYTDIGFARSLDAGLSWIWQGPSLPWHNTCYQIAFDPEIPGKIWGAFSNTHDIPNDNVISGRHSIIMQGGVALSLDHGKTWTKSSLPEAPVLSIVVDPQSPKNKRTLYASVFEKGIYISKDDGATWSGMNEGLENDMNMRVCKLDLHQDKTLTVLITAKQENKVYDAVYPGLYRFQNKISKWSKITETLPLHHPKDFTVNPHNSKDILLSAADTRGVQQGGLYRSIDGGMNWTRIARKGSQHFSAHFHPQHPDWIYLCLCEGAQGPALWLSTDNGTEWQPFTEIPFSNIQRICFNPSEPNIIYACSFGGSIWKGPETP